MPYNIKDIQQYLDGEEKFGNPFIEHLRKLPVFEDCLFYKELFLNEDKK